MTIKQDNFFKFTIDEKPDVEAMKTVATAIKKDAEARVRRCSACVNSRVTASESGYFPVCCLSPKKATMCLIGEKDAFYKANK